MPAISSCSETLPCMSPPKTIGTGCWGRPSTSSAEISQKGRLPGRSLLPIWPQKCRWRPIFRSRRTVGSTFRWSLSFALWRRCRGRSCGAQWWDWGCWCVLAFAVPYFGWIWGRAWESRSIWAAWCHREEGRHSVQYLFRPTADRWWWHRYGRAPPEGNLYWWAWGRMGSCHRPAGCSRACPIYQDRCRWPRIPRNCQRGAPQCRPPHKRAQKYESPCSVSSSAASTGPQVRVWLSTSFLCRCVCPRRSGWTGSAVYWNICTIWAWCCTWSSSRCSRGRTPQSRNFCSALKNRHSVWARGRLLWAPPPGGRSWPWEVLAVVEAAGGLGVWVILAISA